MERMRFASRSHTEFIVCIFMPQAFTKTSRRAPSSKPFRAARRGACCAATLILPALLICAISAAPSPAPTSATNKPNAARDHQKITSGMDCIAISNTAEKSVEIHNYNDTTWDASTRLWQFKPVPELGFSPDAIKAMGAGVGDLKLRNTTGFPGKAASACAVQGGRWLAVVAHEPAGNHVKGQKLWEKIYPPAEDPNNHAVELLPNGNLAVAGTGQRRPGKGNWVRIYNTSNPAVTDDYAEAPLYAAHALLWDPAYNILWAGGTIHIEGKEWHGIFAYIIGGTRERPTITEDVSKRSIRPRGASPNGLKWPHDLSPDFDDINKLWYADHSGVYVYNKTEKTFTPAPGDARRFDGVNIKSAGKLPGKNGKIIVTESSNKPGPCRYTTNTVSFYDPATGDLSFTRTTPACTIYRARIWSPRYQ
ncbi:hypothetical protein M2447_002360 [Ereboglobus sp. PH5-10]|nr:hypothetical protein [Ereboglobus sp. PH5-10]